MVITNNKREKQTKLLLSHINGSPRGGLKLNSSIIVKTFTFIWHFRTNKIYGINH